jgi:DNA primase
MNDFSRQDIESLKANADLPELMRSYGIELKPVGRNLTAICPWHEDTEASLVVNPEKQLYNCFGCDAKGDVLSFLQAQEQLSFQQAVMRLRALAGREPESNSTSSPCTQPPTSRLQGDRFEGGHTRTQLLEKVNQHYQLGLEGSEEARTYLKERKLWDSEVYEGFRFGYCDGTLLKAIPKSGSIRDALRAIGILNSKGKEHFLGCVVVPLFHPTDGLVGFYGRRLSPKSKVRHLFLPGPKRGVFGFQGFEAAKSLYVAEGVLDVLSLWSAGLRPVTCAFGTAGLPAELEKHLRASSVTELRLCFDADRAGSKACEQICEQVGDRFKLTQVLLPDGLDPNEVLVREGRDVLRSFAQCLKPLAEPDDLRATNQDERAQLPLTETTDTDFKLMFTDPDVIYRVTPQPPYNSSRLKITLRAERRAPDGGPRPLKYLDRCDLVSSRSRSETLRGISQKLSLDKETAELHLGFILDTSEDFVSCLAGGPADGSSEEVPVLTESEKLEALDFLRAPNLVRCLQDDMEALGYVGEEKGKLLLYMVGLSRKLENPLSAIIRSQSGAGKSGLASLITSLVPPEDVIHYSRVSAHALAYAGKDVFKRKLLAMEERVGGEAADYYIRILQSSHKIRQAVTVTDPSTGQMRMQEFEVEGPIAYIETTTASFLNQENASRCFEIYLDESEAQTQRIHERQRMSREAMRLQRLNKEAICTRHHNAQRMLEGIPIVIPYVRELTFPTRWLRTRRDNERFLCLIEASAFLHQHQRKKGSCRGPDGSEVVYVEANLDDYRLAYELAKDVLRDTLHELSISARELLDAAAKIEGAFTRRELRDIIGWSQRRIHEGIHELVDMEYLAAVSGSNGRAHQYTVVLNGGERPSPVASLLHPDELARKLSGPGP